MRQLYTSVPNIMKVIEPLFLNNLYEEFEKAKKIKKVEAKIKKLKALLNRLYKMKVFDPACGSGNFLIIAYKELRILEMKIFKEGEMLNVSSAMLNLPDIHLAQFYGIEIDDFAHEIAKLALWLAEHQMNVEFFKEFGRTNPTLPLKEAGQIVQGNATRLDWEDVCPKDKDSEIYILGNPPYSGARLQNKEQKSDMAYVFNEIKGYNNLDYITCWFYKGAKYINGNKRQLAFVSTNSICQGEQVSILWPHILNSNIEIGFAYKSFLWDNNAKNKAAVFCSIVSLRNKSIKEKFIQSKGLRKVADNINAYLVDGKSIFVTKRSKPLSAIASMVFGSMPNDGGHLILDDEEKDNLISNFPDSGKFIYKLIGAQEFTNSTNRWCLWINEKDLAFAKSINPILERIEKVKKIRLNSTRESTRKLALIPYAFGEIRHKETNSIIVPSTTSSRREYVPIGFLDKSTIVNNRAHVVYDSEPFTLGILSSRMHMIWLASIAGRLKNDFLYSSSICYNNFPFPPISTQRKKEITQSVFRILEEREKNPEKTLAQLYDPDKMPEGLREAHRLNDLAIERCYRSKPFESDEERLEYLFKLYEKMIAEEKVQGTLFATEKRTRKRNKK